MAEKTVDPDPQLHRDACSVACHVVQSTFLSRLCSLMDPLEVAPLLKEKSFVTPSTLDHVMLKDEVPSQKNYRILHDVLPCLMNGKSLSEFCQILKSSDRLKEIGEEIMDKYEELQTILAERKSNPNQPKPVRVKFEDREIQLMLAKYANVFVRVVQDLQHDRTMLETLKTYATVFALPHCVQDEKIINASSPLEILVLFGINKSWVDTSWLEQILRSMNVITSLELLMEYNKELKTFSKKILAKHIDPYLPSMEVTSDSAQIHLVVESRFDCALLSGFFQQKAFLSQLLDIPKEVLQLVHVYKGSVVGVWHVGRQVGNKMWALLSTDKVLKELVRKKVSKVRVVFSEHQNEMNVMKKFEAKRELRQASLKEDDIDEIGLQLLSTAELVSVIIKLKDENRQLLTRVSELEARLETRGRVPESKGMSLLKPVEYYVVPTYRHAKKGAVALGSFAFSPIMNVMSKVNQYVINTSVPLTKKPSKVPTEGTPVDGPESPSMLQNMSPDTGETRPTPEARRRPTESVSLDDGLFFEEHVSPSKFEFPTKRKGTFSSHSSTSSVEN